MPAATYTYLMQGKSKTSEKSSDIKYPLVFSPYCEMEGEVGEGLMPHFLAPVLQVFQRGFTSD